MTATTTTRTVTPAELAHRLSTDPELMVIDVRTPGEFETVHIPGSHNVPLDLLTAHTDTLAGRMGEHVVLVCRSGARAGKACEALQQSGLEGIDVLDGGIAAYQDAVGGVNRSGGRWAMDRQVRMTAGTLVLAGTLAGQLVHRRLGLVAGAIGAGLTYSALSDTCAMAAVLARMPWNRTADSPTVETALVPGGVAAR